MQLYACFPWPVETMATGTLHESRSRVPAVLLSIYMYGIYSTFPYHARI